MTVPLRAFPRVFQRMSPQAFGDVSPMMRAFLRGFLRVCLTALLGLSCGPELASAQPTPLSTAAPAAVSTTSAPASSTRVSSARTTSAPALFAPATFAQPAVVQPASTQSTLGQSTSGQSTSTTSAPSGPDTRDIGDIAPDRPGLGDGSGVLGRGVWQIETGWSFESDRQDDATLHELALPLALFRVGVTERFEVRVSADGLLSDSSSIAGSKRVSGGSDLEVGAKVKLVDATDAGFELSVLPIVSLPIGSNAFTSGGYDPTVELAWAQSLPRGVSLSGNVTVASVTEDHHRFTQRILTVSVDRDIAAGWNGFLEAFRASSFERGGGTVWIVDTGATHRLGRQAQFDISVGRGLTNAAPDWFVSAGISWRGFLTRAR